MEKVKRMENIDHWQCANCKKPLTKATKGELGTEIYHDTHFDIMRSNKVLDLEGSEIVEDLEASNTKMHYQLCAECFTKVLNESHTLGSLFWNKELRHFVY
jgi:hypothetical protein